MSDYLNLLLNMNTSTYFKQYKIITLANDFSRKQNLALKDKLSEQFTTHAMMLIIFRQQKEHI